MVPDLNSTFEQSSELADGKHPASRHMSHSRACTNCVRAKAKCSFSIDIKEQCERCHRMNKECTPSPPMRKKRAMKRLSVMETSKLDQKLDRIVTLLKSSTQCTSVDVKTSAANTPSMLRSSSSDIHNDFVAVVEPSHFENTCTEKVLSMDSPMHRLLPAASFSTSGSILSNLRTPLLHPSLQPSSKESELYLNRFRTDFASHLPFIVISPSVTSAQLRQERPILWICIMTVASINVTQQRALSKEVRAIFGREAFVERTKSMDLLLGILVYTTWDLHHSMDRPIFITLLQVAKAMLYELGLEKPVSKDPGWVLSNNMKGHSQSSRSLTMEERRVLLGCFLMSSRSSAISQKGNTLCWTAYSNECLRIIETHPEIISDALLAQQVKLRLLAERVSNAPWSSAVTQIVESANPPTKVYIKSFESHLQAFKSSLPVELAENKTLLMEIHDTSLRIHEIALSYTPDNFSADSNQRFQSLHACLCAANSWVSIFLTISPAQYVGLPTTTFAHFVHLFVSIYRLATFEDPSWDRRLVQETIDVSMFLDTIERNLFLVRKAAGFEGYGLDDGDIFSVLAARVRVFQMWWAAASVDATPATLERNESVDLSMGFLDDVWLRDIPGPWNE